MLEDFYSDALRQIEVSVSGEWQAGATRDWSGEARAAEPIVAVSFSVRGTQVSWCKSERARLAGQPVRFLLGHYDSGGRDVQINFSIGEGQVRSRTVVSSSTYRPPIRAAITGATASLVPFATVEGSQVVQLFALFLAGSDVKVGRNGLWHLRPKLIESVPAAFRKLLTHGRTGELAVA